MLASIIDTVALGFRFGLGVVFVLASLPKLASRREFARAVANYGIVPKAAEPAIAAALPWFELGFAVALFLGLFTAAVAAAMACMLIGFAGAAAFNLVRGRQFECGAMARWPRGLSVGA